MIGLYTKFSTSAEDRPALVALLTQASAALHGPSGCRLYEVALDATDRTTTVVVEIWDSEDAHAASLQLEHSKRLIAQAMPLIAGRPKQIKFGPAAADWL